MRLNLVKQAWIKISERRFAHFDNISSGSGGEEVQRKLDCLIYEMLFIKNKRPCLKTQSGYTRAKLSSFTCTLFITSHGIYRGYYTVARRYEFYVRVARTISEE